MGAVSIDTHKQEREYKNLTLSDRGVVKYLILFRNKVDVVYGAYSNVDINSAGDLFEFNQELICLYSSLDTVLGKINLKEKELKLLELIFDGNTVTDVIKYHNFPKKTAYRILNKIVDKVVDRNNDDWRDVMHNQKYINN